MLVNSNNKILKKNSVTEKVMYEKIVLVNFNSNFLH